MPKYEVCISFQDMLFTVEADSEEKAEEKALERCYESGGPLIYEVESCSAEVQDA